MTCKWTITKEAINALPPIRYEGPVTLVSRPVDVEAACDWLARDGVLGFDTETRPAFKVGEVHPVALLQLAAAEHVFLFQLSRIDRYEPLRALLEAPHIVKAGVAIRDDVRSLRRSFEFQPANCRDLGRLARRPPVLTTGLRSLCAIFLGGRLPKTTQMTNWSRPELTAAQISYAATDAWISRQLYMHWLRGEPPRHGSLIEPPPADDDARPAVNSSSAN